MNLSFSVFKEQLPLIGNGSKKQTIRLLSEHRHWNPGDRVDAYWRLRYPKAKGGSQELFHGLCVGHALLHFDQQWIGEHDWVLNWKLEEVREIPLVKGKLDWTAPGVMREDGFECWSDMFAWFYHEYGEAMWEDTYQVIKFDYIFGPGGKWTGNQHTPRPFGPDQVTRLREDIPPWGCEFPYALPRT